MSRELKRPGILQDGGHILIPADDPEVERRSEGDGRLAAQPGVERVRVVQQGLLERLVLEAERR
jgi:hypothetical protein